MVERHHRFGRSTTYDSIVSSAEVRVDGAITTSPKCYQVRMKQ
ncbi:hypothetical protein COLO4_36587 [Corchorus olitorius]|uniref:Uncharacterized protein n=1 Tax=Corchorus olitorius TaxID=93759 RepID=A0A1R3G7P5_9ROSI|nr:hypothetical protein COLO4_36587 [Corchorus olitorius]